MKPGKYIFFDYDGTIADREKGAPESAKEALRQLKKNGTNCLVVTNRIRDKIQDFIADMNFDGVISGSGADIEYHGKTLWTAEMNPEEVKKIVANLRAYHFIACPEGKTDFFIDPEYMETFITEDRYERMRRGAGDVKPIDYDDLHVAKVGAYYTPESDREGYLKTVPEEYYCLIHGEHFMETVPNFVNKGDAIKRFIEMQGVPFEDTYAFADTYADLEMLLAVNHPVAMGNGDTKLLEVIEDHTKPLLEDGLYLKLKELGFI